MLLFNNNRNRGIVLTLVLTVWLVTVNGLSSLNKAKRIIVSVVEISGKSSPSLQDVFAIADLRYNEWMLNNVDNNSPPLRDAFRAATMDLMEERPNAVLFLARLQDDDYLSTPVGAGEISPYEFDGVVLSGDQQDCSRFLYVTDVVTCKKNRRLGVGTALMERMEEYAIQHATGCLGIIVACGAR